MIKKTPSFLQRSGEYLVSQPLHANVLALVFSLTPLLGIPFDWLARVILIFITLSKGPRAGLITASWCILPAAAIGIAINLAILAYVGFIVMLAWSCGVMLGYFKRVFTVIESVTLVGCGIVVSLHLIVPDITQWWIRVLSQYGVALAKALNISASEQAVFTSKVLPVVAPYATGLQIGLLLCGALFNLWVARFWYMQVYPKGFLKKSTDQLEQRWRISHAMAVLILLVVGLGELAGVGPLRDTLPLFIIPFILSGAYLLYVLATHNLYASIGILVFLVVCLYQPYLFSGIILAAWIDSWYDLSKGFIDESRIK